MPLEAILFINVQLLKMKVKLLPIYENRKLNDAEEAKEKLNDLIDDILRNNNDAYPRPIR